jgi:hypothetical protein
MPCLISSKEEEEEEEFLLGVIFKIHENILSFQE